MKKIYRTIVQIEFLIFSLCCLPFYGIAQQVDPQNLPSFTYSDELSVDKDEFLPAVLTWQPEDKLPPTTIFSENFQDSNTGWKIVGSDWYIQNGKAETSNYHNAESYLISPSFTVAKGDFKLKYKESFELESYHDFGLVWITSDGGSHWRKVHTITGMTDWRETYIDLGPYQGKTIQVAFMLKSDETISGSGWQIDDLEIVQNNDRSRSESVSKKGRSALTLVNQLQDSINAILTGRETNTFPSISATVRVEDMPNLTDANFMVHENGIEQDFNVILPQGEVTRPADIIFIVDNSGSMAPYQQAIQNSVTDFVNDLFDAGINAALGLTRFGQAYYGTPIIEENGTLFTDPDVYLNTIFSRNTDNGGTEPGLDAILESVSGFNFRPNSQKIFIILTDEQHNGSQTQASTVLPVLDQNAVTLFSIIDPDYFSSQEDYGDLAIDSGGQQFEIEDLFDPSTLEPIIDAIGDNIATDDTYIFNYTSSNPNLDGVERKVDIKVTAETAMDTVTFYYTPGAAPSIGLNQNTLDLINNAQPEDSAINIQANIIDLVEPFVQSATLLYKNTNDDMYTPLTMLNASGDLWEAVIPATVAVMPGVDFYIIATDGVSTTSARATSPAENPYQIAINPNVPPQIISQAVTSLNQGEDLIISAEIIDITNTVASASLFYRNVGEPLYREILLTNTDSTSYSATVNAFLLSKNGVAYYIKAVDNFGIGSYFAEPDAPILIEIIQGVNTDSFTIIDSQTDIDILEIQDGGEYTIEDLPELLAIRADLDAQAIGSVVFDLRGPFSFKNTESNAPYALFGNTGSDYTGRIFPPGVYTLTATPFTEPQGKGMSGNPLSVNFSIVIDDIPDNLSVLGFDLYDAVSDSKITDLEDGNIIDLGTLDHNSLSILAKTMPDFVGSLKIEMEGPISAMRIENNRPYTLFANNSNNFFGRVFPTGNYRLLATPFTEANAQGLAGTPLEINFEVMGTSSSEAMKIYPVPFTDHFFVDIENNNQKLDVRLFDYLGQPVKISRTDELGRIRVSTSSLREGLYVMQVFSEGYPLKTLKVQKRID